MTITERKQILLQRLFAVTDEQQLETIEAFMNKQCPDKVLYFSSELHGKIDAALNQMQHGQVFTTQEMEQRLSRWSEQ